MEQYGVFECKYRKRGKACHYYQEIQLFDDRHLYTCSICSYLGGECLCDKEENNGSKEHNSKM